LDLVVNALPEVVSRDRADGGRLVQGIADLHLGRGCDVLLRELLGDRPFKDEPLGS